MLLNDATEDTPLADARFVGVEATTGFNRAGLAAYLGGQGCLSIRATRSVNSRVASPTTTTTF
jgi:hypothetical protein